MTWKLSELKLDGGLVDEAIEVAQRLADAAPLCLHANQRDLRDELQSMRVKLLKSVVESAWMLEIRGPSVVFVAPQGAGKSSLLNGLLGLWVGGEPPKAANAEAIVERSVLPLGAGSTTCCEVHFSHGPNWSVRVEGEEEAMIHERIDGLAGSAYRSAQVRGMGENAADKRGGVHSANTAQEEIILEPGQDVRRCLLGVCGLKEKTLRELADKHLREELGSDALRAELVRRASCSTRVDLRLQPPNGAVPLAWLKKTLDDLTWGKSPAQPFPRRIVVHVPGLPRLGDDGSPVRFIDTQGLRAQSMGAGADTSPLHGRPDLAQLLGDPWSAAVFVAGFPNPPEQVTTALESAFGGQAPLVPPHRAVAPLLYKGEPILIDHMVDEHRTVQKANGARAKRDDVAVPNVNRVLRRTGHQHDWSEAQSPVVDLTRSLGPEHAIDALRQAVDDRFQAMTRHWNAQAVASLEKARTLLNRAPRSIPADAQISWSDLRATLMACPADLVKRAISRFIPEEIATMDRRELMNGDGRSQYVRALQVSGRAPDAAIRALLGSVGEPFEAHAIGSVRDRLATLQLHTRGNHEETAFGPDEEGITPAPWRVLAQMFGRWVPGLLPAVAKRAGITGETVDDRSHDLARFGSELKSVLSIEECKVIAHAFGVSSAGSNTDILTRVGGLAADKTQGIVELTRDLLVEALSRCDLVRVATAVGIQPGVRSSKALIAGAIAREPTDRIASTLRMKELQAICRTVEKPITGNRKDLEHRFVLDVFDAWAEGPETD